MAATYTDVQINKRVLWVGSDAYPLQNIARAQVRVLHPRPGTPVKDFLKSLGKWILAAFGAAIALGAIGKAELVKYVFDGLLLAIFICVIILVRAIRRERRKKPYYLLGLQTSGDPHHLLASTDKGLIDNLVSTIMDAINDVTVTYQNRISNHFGDVISQYGNENIGKMLS